MVTRKIMAMMAMATAILAGCSDSKLREENAELRAKLKYAYAQREAEVAELERRAAIAQSCDYGFSACPKSMTERGQTALDAGFSGGGFIFWGLVIAKFLAFGAAIGVVVGSAGWAWSKISRPSLIELDEAKCLIEALQKKTDEASKKEFEALRRSQIAQESAIEIEKKIASRQSELDKLEAKIAELEAIKNVLSGGL